MNLGNRQVSVATANTTGTDAAGLTLFVADPTWTDITGYTGYDWTCVDQDGGLSCTNPDTAGAGRAWPLLRFDVAVQPDWSVPNIDATAGDDGGHAAVPVAFNWGT